MVKGDDKLSARRAHVNNYVKNYEGHTKEAVKELADGLFLSESTIWKDLRSDCKDGNQ